MKLERIITIVLASLVIGLLVYVLFFDKGKDEYIDKYQGDKDKIDSLTAKINDLHKVQLTQDSLIQVYEDRIGYYKLETNKVDKRIATIRKEYEDRIKDAYNYTPSQLDSFFTNRYAR